MVLMSLNVSNSRFQKLIMFWMWCHGIALWCYGGGAWQLATSTPELTLLTVWLDCGKQVNFECQITGWLWTVSWSRAAQSWDKCLYVCQSPHRISAGGSLLFMRCVSLTLTGLVSAWRWGEAPSAILAKPLSDCVTVLCLRQCKSRHLKVCEILKNTCYFQTNWTSCILNWGVRCDVVSDAGHTCCC